MKDIIYYSDDSYLGEGKEQKIYLGQGLSLSLIAEIKK